MTTMWFNGSGGAFVDPGPTYRFIGYRPEAHLLDRHSPGTLAPPSEPQCHGIVFADGTVACRWLTEYRSTSCWEDLDSFLRVHGHPEYGTVIVWLDGEPDGVQAKLNDLRRECTERMAQRPDPGPAPEIIAAAESERETWKVARAQLAKVLGADPHDPWPVLLAKVRRA